MNTRAGCVGVPACSGDSKASVEKWTLPPSNRPRKKFTWPRNFTTNSVRGLWNTSSGVPYKLMPFGESHRNLAGYFERLTRRPSFARSLAEAEPYMKFFPG